MESYTITGPAKNLIEFACQARQPDPDIPPVEVVIVTFERGRAGGSNAFIDGARAAGLTVEVISERRRFDLGVIPQLKAIVHRCRPDILQSHNVKSHLLVRLSGLPRTYPWIAFHHGYTATDRKDRLYNQCDRWSLRGAGRIVAVCAAFSRRLEAMGIPAGRIAVRHNMVKPFAGVPPAQVSELRARLGIGPQVPVVLSVGRLSAEKGHLDLLEAAGRVRRGRPDLSFRVVLAGGGPERDRIARRASELGLDDILILAGHQADVRPFYSMAGVLALPSHSEGSPNVLLEAMSAGVPVAATAVGGTPEIATHGETALLVAPRDPAAMAAALERLLTDPVLGRRLAEAARLRVAARYTPQAYRRSLTAIYQDVLAQGASHVEAA